MITLEFLGVGDAFDSLRGNSSVLIHSQSKILMDCGYLTPYFFAQGAYGPDFLDAIYLSHVHPDHSFGIVPLLVNFTFNQRKKPLTIIGKPGTKTFVETLLKLSQSELGEFAQFSLDYIETTTAIKFKEFNLDFAPTIHPSDPYSIKFESNHCSFAFSSDGKLTAEQKNLFLNCQTLVFNTEIIQGTHAVHSTMEEVLNYAKSLKNIKNIALIHIDQKISREQIKKYITDNFPKNLIVLIPEVLDKIQIN